MILSFNNNLTNLDVYAQGSELASIFGKDKDENGKRVYNWPDSKIELIHSFENPVLVTDTYKISQLKPTLRDSLFALFQSSKKSVFYDNTKLNFDSKKYLGVWSPSIDTILFTDALRKIDLSNVKEAAEAGAGSGFISKYIIDHAKNLKSIELSDFNHHAYDCWSDNIKDPRANFFIGDSTQVIGRKKHDLIVCNPPYIPRPSSFIDNPYEGIFLIKHLIENVDNILNSGGKLLLNFSSLSIDESMKFVNNNDLDLKVINSLNVPLKVYNVLNNPEWMTYLENKGLHKQLDKGYEYWQSIGIVELSKK